MDLSTRYLGLDLASPFLAGAGPLADDVDTARRLEAAGAGAIVMRSLFEEQIEMEWEATHDTIDAHSDYFAEAQSFLPRPTEFAMGPDQYLKHLGRLKRAVKIPVIASLNGTTVTGWHNYARKIADAGADALELNVFYVASDPLESSDDVERRAIDIVRLVKSEVKIPVAVKLSPFFSSLSHFVGELDKADVDGFVLFNRYYYPDIDPEALEVVARLPLSDPSELPLRLRWLAVFSARVRGSLACTGGVHSAKDAIKAFMAGANVVQMVSSLLLRGPEHLGVVREETAKWLEEHEYTSLRQMVGTMNMTRCPDPGAFERANYMRILSSWRPRA